MGQQDSRESGSRGCYCRPGDVTCGTCERCGRPGHARHFPGPVPYTGAWCDPCYRLVGLAYLARTWGLALVIGVALLVSWRSCGAS